MAELEQESGDSADPDIHVRLDIEAVPEGYIVIVHNDVNPLTFGSFVPESGTNDPKVRRGGRTRPSPAGRATSSNRIT